MQSVLTAIRGQTGTLGIDLQSAVSAGDAVSTATRVAEAEAALSDVMAQFNTRFADRALFAGADADGTALAPAEDLLGDVRALLAAAPDAATALADVEAYFADDVTGFGAGIYTGSDTDRSGVMTADGSVIEIPSRADAPEIRTLLKGLALTAAADPGGFGGSAGERSALLAAAGSLIRDGAEGIVALQAETGSAEARIADAIEAGAAERAALDLATNALTGVDPYVAAARFAELEGQLETLYAVTARLAGLSLTNYLR